jgi:uncharacterized protein (TIGR02391 family)
MTSLADLTDGQIEALPLDRLAIVVLGQLTGQWSVLNFLNAQQQGGRNPSAVRCIAEAVNWLVAKGLVARDRPDQIAGSANTIFVTRLGQSALREGLRQIDASERLAVGLHEWIAKVRSQFLLGEYELAALAAMREVEIRVRELSGADPSLIGVRLMREAFKPDGGPLSDGSLDGGERVAIMELFAGAIGTFKNPPSHRQIDYDDPTEASEVVLLADLLMRLLDRSERRLAQRDSV